MDEDLRAQALRLWEEGTRLLESGRLDAAISAFTRSIDVFPTAEAYTFRGWAYSFQDRIDEAIAECYEARAFPWTNLGRIYAARGETKRAVECFRKALDEQPGAAYAQGMLERLVARRNGLAQSSSS